MTGIRHFQKAVCIFAAVGLWSILYPELVFQKDVCQVEEETGEMAESENEEAKDPQELSRQLFEADREDVHIRFWLAEEWKKWMNKSKKTVR